MPAVFSDDEQGIAGVPPTVRLSNLSSTAGAPDAPTAVFSDEPAPHRPQAVFSDGPLSNEDLRKQFEEDYAKSDWQRAKELPGHAWQGVKGFVSPFLKEAPEELGAASSEPDFGRRLLSTFTNVKARALQGLSDFAMGIPAHQAEEYVEHPVRSLIHNLGGAPLSYIANKIAPISKEEQWLEYQKHYFRKRAEADQEAAPPSGLAKFVTTVAEPVSNIAEAAVGPAATLPATEQAGSNAAQLAVPEAAFGIVGKAGKLAGAIKSTKAVEAGGKALQAGGKVLQAAGELPETVAGAATKALLGEEAGAAAKKAVGGAELASVPAAIIEHGVGSAISPVFGTGAAFKVAAKTGQLARGVGEVVEAMATAPENSIWGRMHAVATSETSPGWMKVLLANRAVKTGAEMGRAAADVLKGGATGAGIGAAYGTLTGQTPEETAESTGGGFAMGAGLHVAKIPGLNNRTVMARTAAASADLLKQHLLDGVPPETLKSVPNSAWTMAAAIEQYPGLNAKVRFIAPDQFAALKTTDGSPLTDPGAGGVWDRSRRTIWINSETKRGADITLLHEAAHPIFDAAVLRQPEIGRAIEQDLASKGQSIDTLKLAYIESLMRNELAAMPDMQTREAAVGARIEAYDAAFPNNAWVYSEALAENFVNSFGTRDVLNLDPTVADVMRDAVKSIFGGQENARGFFKDYANVVQSPVLSKLSRGLLNTMRDYRPGLDVLGGEDGGVKVTPEMFGKRPEAPLHQLPGGELGNDFVVASPDGMKVRPASVIRRILKDRVAAVRSLFDKNKVLPLGDENPEVSYRRTRTGGEAISGKTLPQSFYGLSVYSEDTKNIAKAIQGAIDNGDSLGSWYHQIGSGKGEATWAQSVRKGLGAFTAKYHDYQPFGWLVDKQGNLSAYVFDRQALNARLADWANRKGLISLEQWGGDQGKAMTDIRTYLDNHAKGLKGEENGIGPEKANTINAILTGRNAEFADKNPLREHLQKQDRQGIVRSLRLDRIETMEPSQQKAITRPDYQRLVQNYSPVEFDNLPATTREDIASELLERIPALKDHWSTEYVRQELEGLVDPPVLSVRELPIASITDFTRSPSKKVVESYKAQLKSSEAPPILVDGNKFIDGGHRLQAYIEAGRSTIPAVDIGPLLRLDWEKYLKGEVPPPKATDGSGPQNFSPTDEMDALFHSHPEDYNRFVRAFNGPYGAGQTGWSFELGSRIKTIEELNHLRELRAEAAKEFAGAKAAGDVNSALMWANKAQAMREAYEAATDETLDGKPSTTRDFIKKQTGKDFTTPMPASERTAEHEATEIVQRAGMEHKSNELFSPNSFEKLDKEAAEASTKFAPKVWKERGAESSWFKQWFGKSKVVDAEGKPLPLYHGTVGENASNELGGAWFTDDAKVASLYARRKAYEESPAYEEASDYEPFTSDEVNADEMDPSLPGQAVQKSFLKLENPLDLRKLGSHSSFRAVFKALQRDGVISKTDSWQDAKEFVDNPDATSVYKILEDLDVYAEAKKRGHDGVIISDVDPRGVSHDAYMAFDSSQVKSAMSNKGTFDPAEPNALFSPDEERPDAVGGTIPVIHFSDAGAKLKTIDPAKMRIAHVGQHWEPTPNRSFFFVKGSALEDANTKFANRDVYSAKVDGNKIYDATGDDPLGFFETWPIAREKPIIAAGYDGVLISANGGKDKVLISYKPVDVRLGDNAPGSFSPNEDIRSVAEDYMKKAGMPYEPYTGNTPVNVPLAKQIADWFETAKHEPATPEVKAAYDALAAETVAQFKHVSKAGIKMKPWKKEGQPYKNSAEMIADVKDNKHLWYFPTEGGFGEGTSAAQAHPMLALSGGLPVNDMFRAVHDYFGHAKEGYEFGPRGELNAYLAHSSMFSDAAKPAMAAETLGQNSWVNFGRHLRNDAGDVPKKGEAGYVPQAERPFAEQKATIAPKEFTSQFSPNEPNTADLIEMWSRYGNTAEIIAQRLNHSWIPDANGKEWTKESVKAFRKETGTKFTSESYSPDEEKSPFYSQLSRVIDSKFSGKEMPAAQLAAILRNPQNGIKAEELKWSGLDDYLKGKGRVSKADVTEYLKQNAVQQVKEITKGRSPEVVLPEELSKAGFRLSFGPQGDMMLHYRNKLIESSGDAPAQYREAVQQFFEDSDPAERAAETKFENYQLPGGENYREILFQLPDKLPKSPEQIRADWLQEFEPGLTDVEASLAKRTLPEMVADLAGAREDYQNPRETAFASSHWDEPNVVAHARLNDRVDSAGKPGLFIEEIQSDWHQKGRREGYQEPARKVDTTGWTAKKDGSGWSVYDRDGGFVNGGIFAPSAEAAIERVIRENLHLGISEYGKATSGVPDAPFKSTWHEMVFRRMVRQAAEEGKDWVGWTTGEQQAERYDLSKQIQKVEATKTLQGKYAITATDHSGKTVLDDVFPAEKLPDVVGKDLADRIVTEAKSEPTSGQRHSVTYSGLDLKVGGEGMKGFYDKILVDYANKFGKKFGASVRNKWIDDKPDVKDSILPAQVHSLDITPEMKKSVLEQGVQLFSPDEKNLRNSVDSGRGIGEDAGMLEKKITRLGSRIPAILAAKRSAGAVSPGITFSVAKGRERKNGYAVSLYPELSTQLTPEQLDKKVISDFIRAHIDLLSKPENSLGIWDDTKGSTGKVWIDVVATLANRALAEYAGKKYNQAAIGDISKYVSGENGDIPTGGTGGPPKNLLPVKERLSALKEEFTLQGE